MQEEPKDEQQKKDNGKEVRDESGSYCYDDAHGYEDYEPESDDEEADDQACRPDMAQEA
jgi:hypothetical protein